jgi:hypothetical protein
MPNFIHEGDMVLKSSFPKTTRVILKDYIVSCSGMKLRITKIVTKLTELDDVMQTYEDKFLSKKTCCLMGIAMCAGIPTLCSDKLSWSSLTEVCKLHKLELDNQS